MTEEELALVTQLYKEGRVVILPFILTGQFYFIQVY